MSSLQANLETLGGQNPLLSFQVRTVAATPWTPPTLTLPKSEGTHIVLGAAHVDAPCLMVEPDLGRLKTYLDQVRTLPQLFAEDELIDHIDGPFTITVTRPELEPLKGKLMTEFTSLQRIVDEYSRGSDLFYSNFFANLRHLPRARLASDLFGKFSGIPAAICGAGPSLVQPPEGMLVLAAGSAMSVVDAHFGVACDPHPEQMKRVNPSLPTFFHPRWYRGALAQVDEPLYLHCSSAYPIIPWIDAQLGISGPTLQESHTAVCLAIEIAHALGCSSITLFGMDLAYTNDRCYHPDVDGEPQADPIITYRGHKTHWKWVAEAEWIATYGNSHPDLPFFNATGAGLGFETIPSGRPPVDPCDIPTYQARTINQTPDLEPLRKSVARCAELLEEQTPLNEVELEEELAYELLLKVPHQVARWRDLPSFPFLQRTIQAVDSQLDKFLSR